MRNAMNTIHINQRGVGMIEVLIAILIISIGALGYAALQLRALDGTDEAEYKSQAMAIANDLAERMRANLLDPALADDLTTPQDERSMAATYANPANWPNAVQDNNVPGNWLNCVANPCTPAQMAAWDITQVSWLASNSLPNGLVTMDDCAGGVGNILRSCITVAWNQTLPVNCDPTVLDATRNDCVMVEVMP